MSRRGAAAAAALLAVACPLTAAAQDDGARQSFVVGGGLGVGGMTFSFSNPEGIEDSVSYDEALAVNVLFGGMITPRWGLGVELISLAAREESDFDDDVTIYERGFGAWGRFWPIERLWLQVGLASVRAGADVVDDTYDGVQLSGAVGFEILHSRSWALDIALRLAATGYGEENVGFGDLSSQSGAIVLGFVWFN
jgi:hypothetical protein